MNTEPNSSRALWFFVAKVANIIFEARRSEIGLANLEETRLEIKAILKDMHEFLIERTSDRNAYFVVFAMVALVDENMLQHAQRHALASWSPLQVELFEITDAGTLFYQYIDYFRGRNDIPVVVFEIFYFCLKDGFKGSRISEPEIRDAYQDELKVHIPSEPIQLLSKRQLVNETSKRRVPISVYYFATFLIAIMFRFLLELIPLELPL